MHEVDLHVVFVDFYNQHMRTGSRAPLRVIHGYGSTGGEGTIRRKLRSPCEIKEAIRSLV
jgi:hypothetical protein